MISPADAVAPAPGSPDRRSPIARRLMRDLFLGLAIGFVALRLAGVEPWVQSVDAFAYWTTRSGDPYAASGVGALGAYLYSPAFAQALIPFVWLPFTVFVSLWTVLNIGALVLLVRRWALVWLLFLPVPFEIVSGNVHLLIAVVVAFGFRYPALWSFVLLTKVTPGIGLIWFAVRREWRSLGLALGVTVVIAGVSLVLAPGQWSAWIASLTANASGPAGTVGWYLPVPLLVRLPIAAVIVAWGGLTDRRWTVPVAVTLALPVVWLNGLAVLVALGPVLSGRRAVGRTAPLPAHVSRGESEPGVPA